jgi:hypothetical protein
VLPRRVFFASGDTMAPRASYSNAAARTTGRPGLGRNDTPDRSGGRAGISGQSRRLSFAVKYKVARGHPLLATFLHQFLQP